MTTQTAETALANLLAELADTPRRVRDATAWVEFENDPRVPGRTGYRITGKTADVVQGAIDARLAEIDRCGGVAEFTHPCRHGDQFVSLGYVQRSQRVPA